VGASGSGKTTLALLIAALHDPTTGVVRLDGADVRDYSREELRRRIGVVTQGTTLFQGTILDNIKLGRRWISDREAAEAAEVAALDEDVRQLPSAYGTRLGSAGSGLSGGQRQRVALARALAGRPGLLVLDEATNALDPVTEQAVEHALATFAGTRIVVGHRLATTTTAGPHPGHGQRATRRRRELRQAATQQR
jgi:ABC-type bacteriocin/lantibiotic exporter with double-glycine peptidase domain